MCGFLTSKRRLPIFPKTMRKLKASEKSIRDGVGNWTWYNKTFSKYLLRYFLITQVGRFRCQRILFTWYRNAKVHELDGLQHSVEWDVKNSYINAFLILWFVHLALTKKIASVFVCTKQPNKDVETLNAYPKMTCWTSEDHQYVLAWAQFSCCYMLLGFPSSSLTSCVKFSGSNAIRSKIRARYGYLYFKYNAEAYLWEIVIVSASFNCSCTYVYNC